MRAGLVTVGAAAGLSVTAGARADAGPPAVVYHNGTIITMEADTAEYVDAVAVKDGRIAYAGSRDAAIAAVGGSPTQIDLEGRTMLPGFIDTWGHFALFAQQTLGVNLGYFGAAPPRDKADVVALLKAASPFNGWVIGYGYYAELLSDGPLTLADLDAAFPDTPVLVGCVHESGVRVGADRSHRRVVAE